MRIIGGTFRGHSLRAPSGATRPTTDRTRESIFNLVQHRIALGGARVLDLFAGSGALGLEALSRGADTATFVERAGRALGTIRKNAEALGVLDRCTLLRADVLRLLEASRDGATGEQVLTGSFDLVLADPPYALDVLDTLPDRVLPLVTEGGLFILEHGTDRDFETHEALILSRAYGQSVVSLFRPGSPAESG